MVVHAGEFTLRTTSSDSALSLWEGVGVGGYGGMGLRSTRFRGRSRVGGKISTNLHRVRKPTKFRRRRREPKFGKT